MWQNIFCLYHVVPECMLMIFIFLGWGGGDGGLVFFQRVMLLFTLIYHTSFKSVDVTCFKWLTLEVT
jgi:hypothetical protein